MNNEEKKYCKCVEAPLSDGQILDQDRSCSLVVF